MAASQLSLYNGALRILGQRKLATLTDNVEPRRVLDDVWSDGALNYCLEQGLWTFAMRSILINNDPTVTPGFGYTYGFSKPADYVQTAAICSDDSFQTPLTQYSDEASYWYANSTPIYVQYVSDDPAYGLNTANWSQAFNNFVQAYLAVQSVPRLNLSKEKTDEVKKAYKEALVEAKAKDALKLPTKFFPRGAWVRSRAGARGIFYDPAEQR